MKSKAVKIFFLIYLPEAEEDGGGGLTAAGGATVTGVSVVVGDGGEVV